MSAREEQLIAAALTEHQLGAPNGGTASLSWCDCACGHRAEMWGGTRDWAKAEAIRHVAIEILKRLDRR